MRYSLLIVLIFLFANQVKAQELDNSSSIIHIYFCLGITITFGVYGAKANQNEELKYFKSIFDSASATKQTGNNQCFYGLIGLCYATNINKHLQLTGYVKWGGAQYILPKQSILFNNTTMYFSNKQMNLDYCQSLGINFLYIPQKKHFSGGVDIKYFFGNSEFKSTYFNSINSKSLKLDGMVVDYSTFSILINLAYLI